MYLKHAPRRRVVLKELCWPVLVLQFIVRELGNNMNWGTGNYFLRGVWSKGSNFLGPHVFFSQLSFFCLQKREDTWLGVVESTSSIQFFSSWITRFSSAVIVVQKFFFFDGSGGRRNCPTLVLKKEWSSRLNQIIGELISKIIKINSNNNNNTFST